MNNSTDGWASFFSFFWTCLLSGAAGGLLLGVTAVVVLQSLELLADNKLLMDTLEKHIMDDHYLEILIQVPGIQISIFSVMFGILSSTLSLAVGVCTGFAAHSLVIRRKGEAEMGKALGLAGLVCLMGVTATGYHLGHTLQRFLSMTLNANIFVWLFNSAVVAYTFLIVILCFSSNMRALLGGMVLTSFAASLVLLISLLLRVRLVLVAVLAYLILAVKELKESNPLKLTTAPVPLMLIISDVYNIAGQRIVALQSPTSTTTSSVVVEAIFVGVLASLMWTVTVGMSLFVQWQRGGARQICATAAATGAAALGAIKLALPVLGPGPTIGALMGVAGAAGVSLAAAGTATDQYRPEEDQYGLAGRLGVTVGAAVGAFLSSYTHSGLSGMFMALCAATVPAGAFLKLLYLSFKSWGFKLCLYLIPVVLILFFYTGFFIAVFVTFHVVSS
ncbi:uncharacterized protein LOC115584551 isoform X2 [Sparus aurata]|uniref:uncharacterized protein LOC115584551 isoform X2 n=1 Tax=Sparus aurata TaxID=8175 RepID=UPI0011C19C4F|nr:uncharacterized protein LOC115584551 isoform X2 [Sparus aurata]XP_030277902.1 uncharacterized protein LOC115584551 isoform X2 [Sparus aurata]